MSTAAEFARRARKARAMPVADRAEERYVMRPAPGTVVEAVYRPGFVGEVRPYGTHGAYDDAVPVYWFLAAPGSTAGFVTLQSPHQLCPPSAEVPAVFVAPQQ